MTYCYPYSFAEKVLLKWSALNNILINSQDYMCYLEGKKKVFYSWQNYARDKLTDLATISNMDRIVHISRFSESASETVNSRSKRDF